MKPEAKTFATTVGSQTITFETGKLAGQAGGAVTIQLGDSIVFASATMGGVREGIDFFPLSVDFEERLYATGKIPGSFFRREGRPSGEAILTARLTDRPLRPSFPSDFRNEVQVIATILGVDLVNPHDVEGVADTIRTAVRMPPEERRDRMRRMRASIREQDVFWWVDSYLRAAITKDLRSFPQPEGTPVETAPDDQLPF